MSQQFVNPLAKRIKADAKAIAKMEEDFKVPFDLSLFWIRFQSVICALEALKAFFNFFLSFFNGPVKFAAWWGLRGLVVESRTRTGRQSSHRPIHDNLSIRNFPLCRGAARRLWLALIPC